MWVSDVMTGIVLCKKIGGGGGKGQEQGMKICGMCLRV